MVSKEHPKNRKTAPLDPLNKNPSPDHDSNEVNYSSIHPDDRAANYLQNPEEARNFSESGLIDKGLKDIRAKIHERLPKFNPEKFKYEIDCRNVAASIQELKLYVEYLIKDKVQTNILNSSNLN